MSAGAVDRSACGLRGIAAAIFFSSLSLGQVQAVEPWALVQLPSWWGGAAEQLEAGLQTAANWCKTVELETGRIGPSVERGWRTSDGMWTLGAVVYPASSDGRGRPAELEKARALSAELKAKRLALQCALLPKEGPVGKWILVLEGLKRHSEKDGKAFEGLEVEGVLAADAVRAKQYEAEGRKYAIAILRADGVTKGEIRGIKERDPSELLALGMLGSNTGPGVTTTQLVDAALALNSSESVLRAAALVARKAKNPQLVSRVVAVCATSRLSLKAEEIEFWGEMAKEAGDHTSLLSELYRADAAERINSVANAVRKQSLEGTPVLLDTAVGRSVLLVLPRDNASELQMRGCFELLGAGSGKVLVPKIHVTRSGELGAGDDEGDPLPVEKGASVQVGADEGWILVQPGPDLDPRFRGGSTRLRLACPIDMDRSEVVKIAAARRAISKELWQQCATGWLDAALDAPRLKDHVLWAVAVPGGMWEVDFLPSIDHYLSTPMQRAPFSFALEVANGFPESALEQVKKVLRASGGTEKSVDDAQLLLQCATKVVATERGEDEGTGFVAKKPWVRNKVEARIKVSAGAAVEEFIAVALTTKVFGKGTTDSADARAAEEAGNLVLKGFDGGCASLMERPSSVVVEGAKGTIPTIVIELAAGFGAVRALPKVAVRDQAKAADKKSDRFLIAWPGGAGGLQRALALLAFAKGKDLSTERMDLEVRVPTSEEIDQVSPSKN